MNHRPRILPRTTPNPTLRTARRLSAVAAIAGWIAVIALTVLALDRPSLRTLTGLIVSGFIAGTATVVDAITPLKAQRADDLAWTLRLGTDLADAYPRRNDRDPAATPEASIL